MRDYSCGSEYCVGHPTEAHWRANPCKEKPQPVKVIFSSTEEGDIFAELRDDSKTLMGIWRRDKKEGTLSLHNGRAPSRFGDRIKLGSLNTWLHLMASYSTEGDPE